MQGEVATAASRGGVEGRHAEESGRGRAGNLETEPCRVGIEAR